MFSGLTPWTGMCYAITRLAQSVQLSVGAVALSVGAAVKTFLKRDGKFQVSRFTSHDKFFFLIIKLSVLGYEGRAWPGLQWV